MKRFMAIMLAAVMMLSLCSFTVSADVDLTNLVEESLTTEVSTAISKSLDSTKIETWTSQGVTFASSNTDVMTDAGVVTRPVEDTTVTLTAKSGGTTKTLTYTVIGLKTKVWVSENFNGKDATPDSLGFSGSYASIEKNVFKPGDNALKNTSWTTGTATTNGLNYNVPNENDVYPTGEITVKQKIVVAGGAESDAPFKYLTFQGQKYGTTSNADIIQAQLFTDKNSLKVAGSATSSVMREIPTTTVSGTVRKTVEYTTVMNLTDGKYSFEVDGCTTNCPINNATIKDNNVVDLRLILFSDRVTTNSGDYAAPNQNKITYVDDLVITTPATEINTGDAQNDCKVYGAMLEEAVVAEAGHADAVVNDIDLNQLTQFEGFNVAWSASEDGAITINNTTAKINQTDDIQLTTLTAIITKGEGSATLNIPLIVRPKGDTVVTVGANITSESGSETSDKYRKRYTNAEQPDGDVRVMSCYATVNAEKSVSERIYVKTYTNGNKTTVNFQINYNWDENGNSYRQLQCALPGGGKIMDIYEGVIPEPGEKFKLDVVDNRLSKTYDIYINGQIVNKQPIAYNQTGDDGADEGKNSFTWFASKLVDGAFVIEDYKCLQNSSSWTKVAADLALNPYVDTATALTTTATNSSAEISWNITGDAKIDGNNKVVFDGGWGEKEAILTASATVDGVVVDREYKLRNVVNPPALITGLSFVDSGNGEADGLTNGGKLVSFTTSGAACKAYVCLFNGTELVDVYGVVNVAASDSEDVVNTVNYTLPADVTGKTLKIFLFEDGSLKPLSWVTEK